MKKIVRLQNLDCANCAAKMERAIRKIKGVDAAEVSFIAQKLIIEADESLIQDVLKQAQRCIERIEPDCRILGV